MEIDEMRHTLDIHSRKLAARVYIYIFEKQEVQISFMLYLVAEKDQEFL